jgi:hypothetical protein
MITLPLRGLGKVTEGNKMRKTKKVNVMSTSAVLWKL